MIPSLAVQSGQGSWTDSSSSQPRTQDDSVDVTTDHSLHDAASSTGAATTSATLGMDDTSLRSRSLNVAISSSWSSSNEASSLFAALFSSPMK
eukprot:CAMPEP_0185283800 /NCGR_PEP_ID=MMETSP1363-20130426/696_1 /TAXON_ID=38817 /ORGANISM="Gephyrocapsa oceanica, Strain RCC1303" /LENGTH=92 /DNA_ID=CAMNT_0027879473 /DNA_START=663 /DNA_END=941 /DNA_ORIENTATION=-